MSASAGKSVTGQCLCGAAKFSATLKNQDVHACHCSMCRAWGAGPFMGVDVDGEVNFEDDTVIGRYAGREWAERLFCKECGSSLVWQTKDKAHVAISAGLVDLDAGNFALQVFTDEKPDYYDFAGDSKRMTGSELFAAFAGGQGA